MSKKVEIDILGMEIEQDLPHWLSDEERNRDKGKDSASARALLKGGHDVSDEPRDEGGRWTDGGGGDGESGGGGGDKGEHPGPGYSPHAYVKNGVIHTSNVYDAQRALFENRKVELKQVKQISTLIRRLGETAKEMAEQGEKAPVFNLCNVSIKGTNLFCADTQGIPRVEMPVIPAKQTKDFIKHLKSEGYKVEKGKEKAANLRATQSEIDGAKVATQMARIEKDGFYKRLVVSKDDYILDGHHTWAGELGLDARDGDLQDDKEVKIARVNISITKLLDEANKWTAEHGIAKKPAGERCMPLGEIFMEWDSVDKFNPAHEPAGSSEGGQFAETGGGGAGGGDTKPSGDSSGGKLSAEDKGQIKTWINATAGSAEFEKMRTDPSVIATMQKLPTHAGTIYRGTTFTSKSGSIGSINVGKISNLKVGQVIELNKLSSATTNAGTAVKFAVGPHQEIQHGKIGIKKGFTPVVFAMEQKTGHQLPTKMDTAGEKEVVTMPHTKYKITEITEKEHLKNPKVGKWPYVEIHMVET